MFTQEQIYTKVRQANVKAKKYGNPHKITAREVRQLFNTWHYCILCGDTHNLTLDHIVSLTQGGDNTLDNVQVLCYECNSCKGTEIMTEKYLELSMVCWLKSEKASDREESEYCYRMARRYSELYLSS